MNPEEKELLKKTAELSEQNNKLLQVIWRSQRISSWLKMGYWILIILLSAGAFYGFQKYIGNFQSAFGGSSSSNLKALFQN